MQLYHGTDFHWWRENEAKSFYALHLTTNRSVAENYAHASSVTAQDDGAEPKPIVIEFNLDLDNLPEGLKVDVDDTWGMDTNSGDWRQSLAECACICIRGNLSLLTGRIERI